MHWFSGKALLAGLCGIAAAAQIGWIFYSSQLEPHKSPEKSATERSIASQPEGQPDLANPPAVESVPARSLDDVKLEPASPALSQREVGSDADSNPGSDRELSEGDVSELLHRVGVQIIQRHTRGTGSGVVIAHSPGGFDILTACHVAEDRRDLTVVFWRSIGDNLYREESRAVEVLACDTQRDLARLRVATPIVPDSALAPVNDDFEQALPSDGDRVWGMAWSSKGEPQARALHIVEAKTVSRLADSGAATYWVVDSASDSGMSGGPLLDSHGRLIGVASGNSSGAGYYVHHSEILNFMAGPR